MKREIPKRSYTKGSEKGFTLIEILVAIAIAGIVMAGIYSAYYSQQKSYVVQEQIVAAQQNLRAAMYFMEREIRMAGLDPQQTGSFGIETATSTSFQFQEDISDVDGTGNPDGIPQDREDITYSLDTGNLKRTTKNGSPQTIAENIEALDFVYLDADGDEIPQPIDTATIGNITSVQIAIIARNDNPDPTFTSNQTFTNMQGDTIGTYSDHYRREILTAQVKCRNLGL